MEALLSATIMRKGLGDLLIKVFFFPHYFYVMGSLLWGFMCVFIGNPLVCLCVLFRC